MPHHRVRIALSLLAAGALACTSSSDNPVRAAFAGRPASRTLGASVAFRFPAKAKNPSIRLYRLPALTEAAWHLESAGMATTEPVGFAGDEDQVYTLTPDSQVAALDLAVGKTRLVDSQVVMAALSPTGVPLMLKRDRSLETVDNRSTTPWGGSLPGIPTNLWEGTGSHVVAIIPGDSGRRLVSFAPGDHPVTQRIANGPVAASLWADVIAVAGDSGVFLYDPNGDIPPAFVQTRTHPRAIAVSPSGHRVYAAADDRDLLMIDRFQQRLIERIKLPDEAGAMRVDPLGRMLLIKPASSDSIWIVDPSRGELIAAVPGEWSDDLPAVAPDGTVLLRRGPDVIALAPVTLEILGKAAGAARDRWLVAAWDPRRPALQMAQDTAQQTTASQDLYVQVSSTSNPAWATDLAHNLQLAGLKALVLPPSVMDSTYKVVLGPYPTRDAADAVGRKLGRPYWIFSRDSTQSQ